MADPLELLGAKLNATTRRLVREGATDEEIVTQMRELAAGHVDVLRREAARAIGGWLGLPVAASDLRVAYLLLEAADVPLSDTEPFISEVDAARGRVASLGHGVGAAPADRSSR